MGFLVDGLRVWRHRWVVIGALERVRASETWARARGRLDLFHRREDLQRWCVDERASERVRARVERGRPSFVFCLFVLGARWSTTTTTFGRAGGRMRCRARGGIGDGETLNDGRDGGKTRAWRRDGRRRGRGEGARMKMDARVIRNRVRVD